MLENAWKTDVIRYIDNMQIVACFLPIQVLDKNVRTL